MWSYIARRIIYNIPVYLGIILLVMAALRVNDPIYGNLGKHATQEDYDRLKKDAGLDKPFLVQYGIFLKKIALFDFDSDDMMSWDQKGKTVGSLLKDSIPPSLALTIPALFFTSLISIGVGMVSAFNRGRWVDRSLVVAAVLGMSVSFLVYIILGQYFGAYQMSESFGAKIFAIEGFKSFETFKTGEDGGLEFHPNRILSDGQNWLHYCLLPVMISVIVAMGYDTRFYRAAMVEETGKDYIVTARAKGASSSKIMFVHMLRNAMIPIVTRIMITLPFLITGSFLLEMYFGIPGMGRTLIQAINGNDFPVIQAYTAIFAGLFIVTNILTDVLYAIFDPRVRLL